ncbi:hypothetical protein P886_4783 [Alteromonadaceae bacterium 2753L.S.0a.02]|nr:hypothetical protein P886_4783 [Alteromonadaceae bacterium 2753L.S.0a.02]
MNISELVELIKENPGRFLQDDCIFQLRAFLRGFLFAKNTLMDRVCSDHKLLEEIDSIIRKEYSVLPTERISIEEILDDFEGKNAFNRYLELWSENVQFVTR